ncbi:hypothetical protein C0991_005693 [Blastosporella zonata]|nr:hypothetical protein C0991_005693 [Blastosporella zonata]
MQLLFTALIVLSSLAFTVASVPKARQAANNLVVINSPSSYCLIVPNTPHTNVSDSEHPGGETTYCSASARTSGSQGLIPDGFWRNVQFFSGRGKNGGRYTQLTGCINAGLIDRLNPSDAGGQYDSSGGVGGRGNPAGSVCLG